MTAQELLNRPMEMASHFSCKTKHISYYRIKGTDVWVEHSVRFRDDQPVGKTKVKYNYGHRRYKDVATLIQAINNYESNNQEDKNNE